MKATTNKINQPCYWCCGGLFSRAWQRGGLMISVVATLMTSAVNAENTFRASVHGLIFCHQFKMTSKCFRRLVARITHLEEHQYPVDKRYALAWLKFGCSVWCERNSPGFHLLSQHCRSFPYRNIQLSSIYKKLIFSYKCWRQHDYIEQGRLSVYVLGFLKWDKITNCVVYV